MFLVDFTGSPPPGMADAALQLRPDAVMVGPSGLPGRAGGGRTRLPVFALVPDAVEYVRDSSAAGPVGALRKRLLRATASTLVRLATYGLTHAAAVLRRDFGTLLVILLELELSRLRALHPAYVVLAAPWTDLAVAMGQDGALRGFARHVRRAHRALPYVETRNGGHVLARLRGSTLGVAGVVMPLNPKGYRMKPAFEETLAELQRTRLPVLARDVTAGGAVSPEEAIAFVRGSGAAGVVVELSDALTPDRVRRALEAWRAPTAGAAGERSPIRP